MEELDELEIEYSRYRYFYNKNVGIINTSGKVIETFGILYTRSIDDRYSSLAIPEFDDRSGHSTYIFRDSQTDLPAGRGPYTGVFFRRRPKRTAGKLMFRQQRPDKRAKCFNKILVCNTEGHPNHYSHFKHDTLPQLFTKHRSGEYDLILSTSHNAVDLQTFPGLRLDTVHTISPFQKVKYTSEAIDFISCTGFNVWMHGNWHNKPARQEIKNITETHINSIYQPNEQNNLIYCQRSASNCVTGRILDSDMEHKVQRRLKQFAAKHGLKFVIFSSCEGMTHLDQIKLFRKAKMVVGIHGTAMANLHYVDPNNDCKVLEFTHSVISTQYHFSGGTLGDYMDYYIAPVTNYLELIDPERHSMDRVMTLRGNSKSALKGPGYMEISMNDLEHFMDIVEK